MITCFNPQPSKAANYEFLTLSRAKIKELEGGTRFFVHVIISRLNVCSYNLY